MNAVRGLAWLAVLLGAPVTGVAQVTRPTAYAQLQTPQIGFDAAPDSISSDALIDAGDFYWADGRAVPLMRVTDEVVVALATDTDSASLVQQLTGSSGPLPGFKQSGVLSPRTMLLSGPASRGLDVASRVRGTPGVSWIAPVFFEPESGARLRAIDEIVVAVAPGVDPDAFLASRFASYRPLQGTPDQYVATVASAGGATALDEAARLHGAAEVAWASPNFYQDFRVSTNDSLFGNQWHLNNVGQSGAQVNADVNAPEAWATTPGSPSIVVAVVDNGVQTAHPDLAANLFANPGEIPGNAIDDDGNGWVDDINGWDFVDNDNDPNPAVACDNHGTAVAGVATATGSNALGVTGVCRTCKILPVKVSKDTACTGGGFVADATIATAIYYAAGRTADGLGSWRGADVLNNSWGGGAPDVTLTTAFNWATTNGRGGLGAAAFVASGNGASGYRSFQLTGFSSGNWIIEWRYTKNASVSAGDDTVWLADAGLPDGTIERFDSLSLPSGWSTSGAALWAVVDDPAHAFGTGRYQAKAGTIGNSQTTTLRSRSITVSGAASLTFRAWVSSQQSADILNIFASNNGGASFSGPYFGVSGVPAIVTAPSYPANIASTIAVGASTDWDYRSDYSEYGSELDFVAPSGGGSAGITTTDRTGSNGYNTAGDYTNTASSAFNGTSSATPLAAGIGALLLSKNPNLTAADVRTYLRNTADQIGGVTYPGGFSPFYGYGRLNASAALAAVPAILTETPTNTATSTSTSTPTQSPTASPTLSATATPTATATVPPTSTSTVTATATATGTATPVPTATSTPTLPPTLTPTLLPTQTSTGMPSLTATPTPTPTSTATSTLPATLTPTLTPTATVTPGQVCMSFATGVCCDSAAGTNCKAPAVVCTSNAGCAGQAPFTVCAGASTGSVQAASTTPSTYGGFAFRQCSVGAPNVGVSRSLSGGTYTVNDGLLQWDTSALPDTAQVTTATLTVSVAGRDDSDARNFQGEWFNWGAACDASDWADTVASTAFSVPNSSLTVNSTAGIALTGAAANVSLTGRTYLRLNESGGQPTGLNRVLVASFSSSAAPGPSLTVCYSLAPSPPTSTPTPASPPPSPTNTPASTATATLTSTWTPTSTATATPVPPATPTWTRTSTATATTTTIPPTPTSSATSTPTITPTAASAVCTSFATGVCCDSAAGSNCKTPAVVCTSNSGCAGQAPFTVCAGASTDSVQAASTTPSTYGGFAFRQCSVGAPNVGVSRSLSGGTYAVNDGLLQWDTSALPDTAQVTTATLTVSVTGRDDSDARNFQGEWFNWGTACDASDWADTVASTAFSVPNSSLTVNSSASIPLTGAAANVNLTGRTYLRLNESGGQPTGLNRVLVASFSSSAAPGPGLTVCYVLAPPTPTITPTRTPTP